MWCVICNARVDMNKWKSYREYFQTFHEFIFQLMTMDANQFLGQFFNFAKCRLHVVNP